MMYELHPDLQPKILSKVTSTHMLFYDFSKTLKITLFTKLLLVAASVSSSYQLQIVIFPAEGFMNVPKIFPRY